jgi:hypothetical protein
MGPAYRELPNLFTFSYAETGDCGQLEESRDSYVTPVILAMAVQRSTVLRTEEPILMGVDPSFVDAEGNELVPDQE